MRRQEDCEKTNRDQERWAEQQQRVKSRKHRDEEQGGTIGTCCNNTHSECKSKRGAAKGKERNWMDMMASLIRVPQGFKKTDKAGGAHCCSSVCACTMHLLESVECHTGRRRRRRRLKRGKRNAVLRNEWQYPQTQERRMETQTSGRQALLWFHTHPIISHPSLHICC